MEIPADLRSLSTTNLSLSSSSIARASLARTASFNRLIQPIRIIKPTFVSIASSQEATIPSINTQTSDLSPPIITNMNEFKSFLNMFHPSNKTSNEPARRENIGENLLVSSLNENSDLLKRNSLIKIGDFILFEANSASADSFNSAYNTRLNEYFYWKVGGKNTVYIKTKSYY
jgi:hypothetical protein